MTRILSTAIGVVLGATFFIGAGDVGMIVGALAGGAFGFFLASWLGDIDAAAERAAAGAERERQRSSMVQSVPFERRIESELARGGRLESRTATTAVIIHGRRVSHLLHFFIGIFTLGLWWVVWLLLAIFGGERRVVLNGETESAETWARGSSPNGPELVGEQFDNSAGFCTQCGAALSEEGKFCGQCGEPAEEVQARRKPPPP